MKPLATGEVRLVRQVAVYLILITLASLPAVPLAIHVGHQHGMFLGTNPEEIPGLLDVLVLFRELLTAEQKNEAKSFLHPQFHAIGCTLTTTSNCVVTSSLFFLSTVLTIVLVLYVVLSLV